MEIDALSSPLAWIIYSVVIFASYVLMSKFFESPKVWQHSGIIDITSIPAVKTLKDEDLTWQDHFYTTLNRAILTPIYIYHFITIILSQTASNKIDWTINITSFISIPFIFLQFILLFSIYDFIYHFYHKMLHKIPLFYRYIHKHHHLQISPYRGTYDGLNVHPIEFILSTWLHIMSILILSCILDVTMSVSISGYAIMLFKVFAMFLASLNHTRHNIKIPYFYKVYDHDTHHRLPQKNFGQFIMWWDILFGTYLDGEIKK